MYNRPFLDQEIKHGSSCGGWRGSAGTVNALFIKTVIGLIEIKRIVPQSVSRNPIIS